MKIKSLLFFILLNFFCSMNAQNEFITVWKPSNTGFIPSQTTSSQIYFPGIGNNYNIYWEEIGYPSHNATIANVTTSINNPLLIDFGTASNPVSNNATYTLKVSHGAGNFHRIYFYAPTNTYRGDSHKLMNVVQWGNIPWSNMERAFHYCTNMDVTATDIPILTYVTDMSGMFAGCYVLNGNSTFNNWDVSNVTNFSQCFIENHQFNQPIASWDISHATDISFMFGGAGLFNQPIGVWDTSNITNMSGVFNNAAVFNQPLSSWDTSKVTNMGSLFSNTMLFNQPISNWDTSNVTDMSFMFSSTGMFDQPIGNWNISKVTNLRFMFGNSSKFNQPISNWNTSVVTDMSGMFRESDMFNQPIGNWNTSNVTNMLDMFADALKFNQPIANWNTSLVTDMSHMFYQAQQFNQPIGNWNTTNVNNMYGMFFNNPAFNQPIETWNTSAVKDMRIMFKNAAFNQSLANWNLSAVTQMNFMLDSSGLSCNNYNSTLQGWANSNVTPNNISLGAQSLKYSTPQALAARNILTNQKNWTISNDNYSTECNMLSTSEMNNKESLKFYPNPAKNTLYFSETLHKIEIYSLDGKLLKIKPEGNDIEIYELPKGIYILKAINHSENSLSKKFIKD